MGAGVVGRNFIPLILTCDPGSAAPLDCGHYGPLSLERACDRRCFASVGLETWGLLTARVKQISGKLF